MTERGRRLEALGAVARPVGLGAQFQTPTTLTNDVTHFYVYDAFGNTIARSGTTFNNLLYCGEQFDSDLSLYFLRARYMDTERGRFWTMDEYGPDCLDPRSLHKYLYAIANPVNRVGPSGFQSFTLTEVQGAAAVILVLDTLNLTIGAAYILTAKSTAGFGACWHQCMEEHWVPYALALAAISAFGSTQPTPIQKILPGTTEYTTLLRLLSLWVSEPVFDNFAKKYTELFNVVYWFSSGWLIGLAIDCANQCRP